MGVVGPPVLLMVTMAAVTVVLAVVVFSPSRELSCLKKFKCTADRCLVASREVTGILMKYDVFTEFSSFMF